MIKFKKMLNSRGASPEIVEVYASIPYGCRRGELYQFVGTQLTPHAGIQKENVFVPIDTYPISNAARYIKGFFVTEDVLFESPLYGDLSKVSSGCAVSAEIDDTSELLGVSGMSGDFAIIHEIFKGNSTNTATFTLKLH